MAEPISGPVGVEQMQVALHVLRSAVPYPESTEAANIRAQLMPLVKLLLRREKQLHRQATRQNTPPANPCQSPEAAGIVVENLVDVYAMGSGLGTCSVPNVTMPPSMFSRILYPNPVCFLASCLSTCSTPEDCNLMTISWISPLDNCGRFTCSVNQNRHTAKVLSHNPLFSLSVATVGMEETLRKVGSCSGSRNHKPSKLGVGMCWAGWRSSLPLGATSGETQVDRTSGSRED
eukprot:1111636-Pleurochrysis_carterae.AAC.1